MEEPLPGRPGHHRKDAISEWRPAHDHWRRARKLSRNLRWSLVSILGADFDAGNFRPHRIQVGGSQRARLRELRLPETRRHAAAGAGGVISAGATTGKRLPGNQPRARNPAPALVAQSLQCCGRNAADPRDRIRGRAVRPSDCVRECQHAAAGQVLASAAGNDGASRARRRPRPLAATTPDRRPDSLGVCHRRRNRRRALVPECIGSRLSVSGSGHHCQSAGSNRLARSGGERRGLRARDVVVRSGSGGSSEQGRSGGRDQFRIKRRRRWPRPLAPAFGFRSHSNVAQFRFDRRRRPSHAKPATDSKREPRLFD